MDASMKETIKKIKDLREEIIGLEDKLVEQAYQYLQSIGINKGTRVKVKSSWSDITTGIFSQLKIEYGEVKPIIMKTKKDGTAHNTATVYCYQLEDMKKGV